MKRITLIIFGILSVAIFSYAQTEPAGKYMFENFQRGIGKMRHGLPIADNFNYDVVKEEMHFMNNGEEMLLVMPNLDTLTIANRVFVPVGNKFSECIKLDNGMTLKILWHSKQITAARKGAFGMKSQANVTTLRFDAVFDQHVRQDTEEGVKDIHVYNFVPDNTYLVTVNGKTLKFTNAKSFAKAFKLPKDEVDATMKKNNWTFTHAQDVVSLLNSMEFK